MAAPLRKGAVGFGRQRRTAKKDGASLDRGLAQCEQRVQTDAQDFGEGGEGVAAGDASRLAEGLTDAGS